MGKIQDGGHLWKPKNNIIVNRIEADFGNNNVGFSYYTPLWLESIMLDSLLYTKTAVIR